jgi:phosphatidylserine decarboxylase
MNGRPSFIPAFLPPLSPEAWRVIPWFAVGTLVLFWIWTPLGWIGVAFTLWCVTLFREPVRTPPARNAVAVSPVDGLVTAIATLAPAAELNLAPEERACVTIALGPWDSHVARVPCGGRLARIAHGYGGRGGERLSFVTESAEGAVATVLVAEGPGRRVRSAAGEGQTLTLGERFAVVLFAGRAEVYLPPGAAPAVAIGQRMVAGETPLA